VTVIDDYFILKKLMNLKEKIFFNIIFFLQIFFTKWRKFATQKITRLDILVLDFGMGKYNWVQFGTKLV
jgi:hypothetical protein